MRLPNKESAYVSKAKLIDYLLSQTHVAGKSKSKFFRKYGFDDTNIAILEQGLKKIAREHDIIKITSTLYGEKYIIEGELQTPVGRTITVRTVWIIEKDEVIPRFVTAYPV